MHTSLVCGNSRMPNAGLQRFYSPQKCKFGPCCWKSNPVWNLEPRSLPACYSIWTTFWDKVPWNPEIFNLMENQSLIILDWQDRQGPKVVFTTCTMKYNPLSLMFLASFHFCKSLYMFHSCPLIPSTDLHENCRLPKTYWSTQIKAIERGTIPKQNSKNTLGVVYLFLFPKNRGLVRIRYTASSKRHLRIRGVNFQCISRAGGHT